METLLIISAFLVIYEILARSIPTRNNWSVIHKVVHLIDITVKNKTVITRRDTTVDAEFRVTKVTSVSNAIKILR